MACISSLPGQFELLCPLCAASLALPAAGDAPAAAAAADGNEAFRVDAPGASGADAAAAASHQWDQQQQAQYAQWQAYYQQQEGHGYNAHQQQAAAAAAAASSAADPAEAMLQVSRRHEGKGASVQRWLAGMLACHVCGCQTPRHLRLTCCPTRPCCPALPHRVTPPPRTPAGGAGGGAGARGAAGAGRRRCPRDSDPGDPRGGTEALGARAAR